jgi:sialidase-1
MFSHERTWRIAVAFLVLVTSTYGNSKQPMFATGTVASAQSGRSVINAYPVIARLANGRLLCVFSVAAQEKPSKMKIAASISDDGGLSWSVPQILFDHLQSEDADPNLLVDGSRVLVFSTTIPEPVRIDRSQIYMRESEDGVQWSAETLLNTPHRYIAGKIHQGHRLHDGTLVMGYAWDRWAELGMPPATEGEMDINSGMLRSQDGGITWKHGGDLHADIPKTSPHSVSGLDEPASVVLADGRLMVLMRTSGDKLFQSWSHDGGMSWETPHPSTLVAHNSPAALWKLDKSPDILVAWDRSATARTPLVAALSGDGGHTWSTPKVICSSDVAHQVSYPSAVQSMDGTMIVVWQQQIDDGHREIRIARFSKAWLLGK